MPSYKRLTLMLRDPERLKSLLLHPKRPVQIVVAGKAHPADDGGKQLIQQLVRFTDDPAVRHRIVFLPDYDMAMAQPLYPGCDVWLNNPLRPLEACGTSGMKAALNGGLNLSILDGWWDEMYDGENGWAIPTADGVDDPDRRDDLEAAALYDLIENGWRRRSTTATTTGCRTAGSPWCGTRCAPRPEGAGQPDGARLRRRSSTRPRPLSGRAVDGPGYVAAKDLAAWKDQVHKAWPTVRVDHVESSGVGESPELGSDPCAARDRRRSGGLSPGGRRGARCCTARSTPTTGSSRRPPCRCRSSRRSPTATVPLRGVAAADRTGPFGYTVRVLPSEPAAGATAPR